MERASAAPRVSISVVSHRQAGLAQALLADLGAHVATSIEVILTLNMPETLALGETAFPVRVLRNPAPKGFGANHNAAFRESRGAYFCVLNPDIRIARDPFPVLIDALRASGTGVAAPLILDPAGAIEDSARRFPTPGIILRKALGGLDRPDYAIGPDPIHPDWVAGMFMLFPREVYAALGGFDERYFLYYEDVDLCARLARMGRRAVLCPGASAVHAARRQSRRSLRYLRWHLASMLRFFVSRRG